MAAHRHPAEGWLDTPVNPAVGLLMFVIGLAGCLMLSLLLFVKLSGY